MAASPVMEVDTPLGAPPNSSVIAASASRVFGSVPMALNVTTTSATWPSLLMRALAVCSSAVVGERMRSTAPGLCGPFSQSVTLPTNPHASPVETLLPLPASNTSTALLGEMRPGKSLLTTSTASRLAADLARKARWSLTATLSMLGATSASPAAASDPGRDDEPTVAVRETAQTSEHGTPLRAGPFHDVGSAAMVQRPYDARSV